MRKFFNGLALGVILGGGVAWYLVNYFHRPPASEAEEQFRSEAAKAVDSAGEAAYRLTEAVKIKTESFDLRAEDVKQELARYGKVIRRKAGVLAGQLSDADADARVTAAIREKLAADKDLSAGNVSVKTEGGNVTLEGSVASEAQIGRAVLLALETDGVREVTSHLKVKPQE